jgi:hypothetical protein
MSVSAISSMTSITPIGVAAPIAPASPVDRVVRRRKAINAQGKVVANPLLAPASAASTSTSAVLTALIGLHPGG